VLKSGARAAVTGATGFIGSAIVRALLARGLDVIALCEPGADAANLNGLEVERREADVRDAARVAAAIEGSTVVFHTAARYRFWAPNPRDFYAINVEGTRHVLEAARAHRCELIVYTSTVGVLGLDDVATSGPATETSFARVDHLFGAYKQTKYVAEHEVLRECAQGLPVVLVLPTTPLGPGDRAPTPTGRIVVDSLNGKMPGWYDTTLNVVDVDDVANGHLLAAEHGAIGRSYIVGGENLSLRALLEEIAAVSGLAPPRFEVPRPVALLAALVSEIVEGRLLGRPPHVPLEGARMATTRMAFDDARARAELGYTSRPARAAVERSVRYFIEEGFVRPERRAMLRLPRPTDSPPSARTPPFPPRPRPRARPRD
jgi:dihydroflavonol-4-reductase